MKTRQDLSQLSTDELIDLVLRQQEMLATASPQISNAGATQESTRSDEMARRVTQTDTPAQSHSQHHHHHRRHHRSWYKRLIDRVFPSALLTWKYWVIILALFALSILVGLAIAVRAMQGG